MEEQGLQLPTSLRTLTMSSASACAGGSKPSGSASSIIAATASGYHLLKVDGYSRTKGVPTGEKIKSHPFTLCGHLWHIDYHPNGQTSGSLDYISFFLCLDENAGTEVKAQHRFRLLDEAEDQAPSLTSATVRNFVGPGGWGTPKFITRKTLEESKYLKDDSFTIRCDIVVIGEFRTEMATTPALKFVSVPPPDLNQHLGDLLNTEKGADVVFEVGGETFAAHRCVLAARSPVFSAELFGAMKESGATGVVRIDDMEAQVFRALLCFAYTDSFPETKTQEEEEIMCHHLLVAADRYNMERLKLICEEKLCDYINIGSVATILALAEQHHCEGLKKACFEFLGSPANVRAVVATDGFQRVYKSCLSVVMELIAMSAAAP